MSFYDWKAFNPIKHAYNTIMILSASPYKLTQHNNY